MLRKILFTFDFFFMYMLFFLCVLFSTSCYKSFPGEWHRGKCACVCMCQTKMKWKKNSVYTNCVWRNLHQQHVNYDQIYTVASNVFFFSYIFVLVANPVERKKAKCRSDRVCQRQLCVQKMLVQVERCLRLNWCIYKLKHSTAPKNQAKIHLLNSIRCTFIPHSLYLFQ